MKLMSYFKTFLTMLMLTMSMANFGYADTNQLAETSNVADLSLQEAQQFIKDTGNEIISILAKKTQPLDQRKEKFRVVLVKDFNIAAIGRFALGKFIRTPEWRELDNAKKDEYTKLFEDSIVESYAAQFNNYSDQELIILSASQTDDGGVIVKSEVKDPHNGNSAQVSWKVLKKEKTGTKIYDVVINGVSMRNTQRTQYAGILADGNGIDGLLKYMRSNRKVVDPVAIKNRTTDIN